MKHKVRIPRIGRSASTSLLSTFLSDTGFFIPDKDEGPNLIAEARASAFASRSADEFADHYLREQVFSKWSPPGDRPALEKAAIEKYLATEDTCREFNSRFVGWEYDIRVDPVLIRTARSLIQTALGPFAWEEFPTQCRFGPGASTSIKARNACHQTKWQCSEDITASALPYFHAFRRWAGLPDIPGFVKIVLGNKVTTVPKNWKARRMIAIEPDWNMFLQLGVGKMLRRRLQRLGLLHRDAQQRNRALAKLGSESGLLSTIDLSAASDSISLALCEALLPPDWFQVILDLRSPCGELPDGTIVTYEKVSSMGNGFTFELETLIFWALARAVCGRESKRFISVYGDDIIVPSAHAEDVIAALAQAGFTTNSDKTFISGPFRESCGGHYWAGTDVTPFYVRDSPETLGEVIDLGNRILEYCLRRGWSALGPFHRTISTLRDLTPRRFRGPWGCAGALASPWDIATPKYMPAEQRFSVATVERDRRYHDVSDAVGSLLMKLWYVDTDLHPSKLTRALTRERVGRGWVGQRQWHYPLAC